MCELFGFSGNGQLQMNTYLKEFVSHSVNHPDGWGMALFRGNSVNIEKEPATAYTSAYLHERLLHKFKATAMMAHIRLATKGGLAYENTHPFVMYDDSDRTWTLVHNGTIFDGAVLDVYRDTQEGRTDSERILCHIIERMNAEIREKGDELSREERFAVMDRVIHEIAPNNKLNLLIYDGELLYVHTNMRNTLYMKEISEGRIFATVPLDREGWEPVTLMQLLAFRKGEPVLEGIPHTYEYVLNPQERILQSDDFACL